MYVYKRHIAAFQMIATFVAVSLVLWALGVHMFTRTVEAASVTSFSDTLSDSAPDEASDHTIVFTTPNGMVIGQTFTVTWPAGFDLSSIVIGDVDLASSTNATLAASAAAGVWGYDLTGQVMTFETPTDIAIASSTTFTVSVGTVAAGGTNQVTNPSATSSYEIVVGGTMQDNGNTRVAIIENVLVTAEILTTLLFTITGVADAQSVNGTTTTATSTNTTVPFGTLSADTIYTLAQDLSVTTNAANGYVVTVYQDTDLVSATLADIDSFIDDIYSNTPVAWVAPGDNIADENTWGHWGISSEDGTTTRSAPDEFDSGEWVQASTTPIVIMSHTDPADGTTQGIGLARVGYQVEVTPLQEAGDDYSTVLTYIATPTF